MSNRRKSAVRNRPAFPKLNLEQLEDRCTPAPFAEGNIVIYRVGDGAAALSNTGNAVFLDEYTPAGVLVQSIAMPTTASGPNKQLIASGTEASEGFLTRSENEFFLMLTGYASNLPGSPPPPPAPPVPAIHTSDSTMVNRVVGRVNSAGIIDTTTALTDAANMQSIRGVASTDGNDIWVTGGAGGVRYTTLGNTSSTQLATMPDALRTTSVYAGQLFVTGSSGVVVGRVGVGTPTTAGQTITNLPGFPASGSPFAFFFADLTPAVVGLDTLYVADEGADALTKYSLSGGNWVSNGTIGTDVNDYRGLTGTVSGNTVTLFAVRGGNQLVRLTDGSGHNQSWVGTPITSLATAGANQSFRGVALTPTLPVVGTPTFTNATTNEDTQTTSGLVINSSTTAGDDTSHFKITGITNGSLFLNNGVTPVLNGDFITEAQAAAGLKFTPNLNFFSPPVGRFNFQASWTNRDEGLGGPVLTATITVNPIADTPSVTNATTTEDTQTTSGLVITANPVDLGSVTHYKITGINNGRLFLNNGSTEIVNDSFITASQGLLGLKFTPAPDFFGTGSFQIQASIGNSDTGLGGNVIPATITVNPIADAPTVTHATTNEDAQTTSGLVITRNVIDGLEVTHFKITGITNGTLFQNDGTTPISNGSFITAVQGAAGLKFTPNPDFFGTGTFNIQGSRNNTDAGLGGNPITATITVNPRADTPSVNSTTTDEDRQTLELLQITPNALDGGSITHFKITAITNGTLFLNDGTTVVNANEFISFAQGTAGLRFTPSPNFFGTGSFDVQASTSNSDSDLSGGTVTATITVNSLNDKPSFTLASTNVRVDQDSGAFRQSNFSTFAPGGGPDESMQTVTYTLTNSNDSLFTELPRIAPDGTLTFTPTPGVLGSATVTVNAIDNGLFTPPHDNTATAKTFTINVTVPLPPPPPAPPAPPPPPPPPAPPQVRYIAIGSDAGTPATVRVLNALTRAPLREFQPFGGFAGGVQVEVGDVTGDGISDIIVGTATGSTHVKVFDGVTGVEVRSFFAFEGFDSGVSLAVGDLNGDRLADIIVGTASKSNHVKAFNGAGGGLLRSFFAYPGFNGGVKLAAGDVNRDGLDDIAILAGPGGNGHIKVTDGATGLLMTSFIGYDGYAGDINLAVGDVFGNGSNVIITTARNPQLGTHVKAFTAQALLAQSYIAPTSIGTEPVPGAARVSSADMNGDGIADVLLASPPGAGASQFAVIDGITGRLSLQQLAFGPQFGFGVFVGVG